MKMDKIFIDGEICINKYEADFAIYFVQTVYHLKNEKKKCLKFCVIWLLPHFLTLTFITAHLFSVLQGLLSVMTISLPLLPWGFCTYYLILSSSGLPLMNTRNIFHLSIIKLFLQGSFRWLFYYVKFLYSMFKITCIALFSINHSCNICVIAWLISFSATNL